MAPYSLAPASVMLKGNTWSLKLGKAGAHSLFKSVTAALSSWSMVESIDAPLPRTMSEANRAWHPVHPAGTEDGSRRLWQPLEVRR